MTVEFRIIREDGTVLVEHVGDATIPQEYKCLPDKPIVEGRRKFYGFTYQPTIVIELPSTGVTR